MIFLRRTEQPRVRRCAGRRGHAELDVVRLTLLFFVLALTSGYVLFHGALARASVLLDMAFVASVVGFLVSLVLLLANHARKSADKHGSSKP